MNKAIHTRAFLGELGTNNPEEKSALEHFHFAINFYVYTKKFIFDNWLKKVDINALYSLLDYSVFFMY